MSTVCGMFGMLCWKWGHHMETFSALLVLRAGNSPVTGEFPSQRPVDFWVLMVTLICAWINGWVNNREAGDLRCHRAHYDVMVMKGVHILIAGADLGRGLLKQSLPFSFSQFSEVSNYTHRLLNIAIILDRYHRSWAAAAPVKYEGAIQRIWRNLCKTKISLRKNQQVEL